MIWLPIHTDLPRHLKMTRLTKALNVKRAQAVGHMVMLWLWALESAPNGNLSEFTDEEIAAAAGWNGKDKHGFVSRLIGAGFLDSDYRIHNWDDYAGALLLRRENDRIRKREKRMQLRQKKERLDNEIAAEDLLLSDGHPL